MNREILFRGKRVDNGEWKYGAYIKATRHWHKHGIHEDWICSSVIQNGGYLNLVGRCPVKAETVGQYIGLTDKNGEKIFEHDFCRFREWSKGEMCWIGKVCYEHQQFIICGGPNKECEGPFLLVMSRFCPANIEVIGNIHDNPELLEKEKE